jgi:hypothetical protein
MYEGAMGGWMMLIGRLVWLLVMVALVLGIAALLKDLRS